jgi:hypothetical protein
VVLLVLVLILLATSDGTMRNSHSTGVLDRLELIVNDNNNNHNNNSR